MFKRSEVFSVYPNHPTATNLSMAAGGVRLLSWLTLAAAVVATLLTLVPAARVISFMGLSHGMYYILDELDEVLLAAFGLWCVFVVLRYAAAVLQAKARQLVTDLSIQ